MKGFIYIIKNTNNQKVYIGQTSRTIQDRWEQHKNAAIRGEQQGIILYNAMRKYGVQTFYVSKLEEVDLKDINEKEKYWIKYYDSFYTTGKGYNLTEGGQWGSGTQILTTKQADEIKLLLVNTDLSFVEIAKKYNVSPSCICDINIGRSFNENIYNYPIRKTGRNHSEINDTQLNNIINMLINSKETFSEIARKNSVKEYTIGIINRGIHSLCPKKYSYPLRKIEQKFTQNNILTKEDVKQICYELCFSTETLINIGKKYHIAKNTIGDISRGITWKEITQQFKCPIRKNAKENQKIYQSIYGIV